MIYKRFFKLPSASFFLFGPRGVGKSTLIQTMQQDAYCIDLLQPDIYREFKAHPEKLKDIILGNEDCKIFVIDEVQKVPELLDVVHYLLELKKGYKFILTGSSSVKLRKTGVDLLAGRAILKLLHPFMAAELGDSFNLAKNLQTGMLPLVVDSENAIDNLKTYIALYMQEEVQMEGLVRKIDNFSRFLEAISFSQGSVLNYSNIARDCHVSSKTIENYLNILENLLLSFRLEVFTKKAKRNIISHPKFYFFDVGVYRALRPTGPLDNTSNLEGHALETLVAQHLRAYIDYSAKDGKLYFWQTKSGLEVDFVIYGEIGFYAMEVKNSLKIKKKDLRGLQEFSKDYPIAKLFVLYRGKDTLKLDNIIVYPVEKFLSNLKVGQDLV